MVAKISLPTRPDSLQMCVLRLVCAPDEGGNRESAALELLLWKVKLDSAGEERKGGEQRPGSIPSLRMKEG